MNHDFTSGNAGRRHHNLKVGTSAILVFMWASSPVMATTHPMVAPLALLGVAAKYQPLTPARLAGIRGKYVNGAQIVYFGLSMSSQWTTELTVNSQISINFGTTPGATPTIKIQSSSTGAVDSAAAWSGPSASWQWFPFNNAQGVKQDIQVAGDSNQVKNNITVQVSPWTGQSSVPSFTGPTSGAPYSAYYKNQTAVGGVVVGANGAINLGITVPGVGLIGQQLGSGGINQYASISADMSSILNNLTMQIGTNGVVNPMYAQQLNTLLQDMPGITP